MRPASTPPSSRAIPWLVAALLVSAGCTSEDGAAVRQGSYPLAAFPSEAGQRLLTRQPPKVRWIRVGGRRSPVLLGPRDFYLAALVDDASGAVVRGSYGFAAAAEPKMATRARFRVEATSPAGGGSVVLLEAVASADGTAARFEDFEVRMPEDWQGPAFVGVAVAYLSKAAAEERRRAAFVDPVIETRRKMPAVRGTAANVLLITADTTRQDVLGVYGGEAPTPNLDCLAADGVVFDNGFSVAFGTAPSHASLLTASHPREHGIYDNGSRLAADRETLPEVLAGAGYVTAAFVSAKVVARVVGMAQGFDVFDDVFAADPESGLGRISEHQRRADLTVERFLDWFGARPPAPFFTWIHLYDPHQPYAAPDASPGPEPLRGFFEDGGGPRHLKLPGSLQANPDRLARVSGVARQRYAEEVTFMDRQLGRVFDALREAGVYDETVVVFVADHGENMMEHGPLLAFEHHGLFSGVSRLPVILKLAGSEHAGSRRSFLFGNLDLAPTVLDLLDLDAPAAWKGRSFRRLLAGREGTFRPHLVLEGGNHQEVSVRTPRWMFREALDDYRTDDKILRYLGYTPGRTADVYDLAADPAESRSLDPEGRPEAEEARRILAEFRAAGRATAEEIESDEHRKALEALGYVGN